MVAMHDPPYVSFTITERSEVNLLKKLLKKEGLQAGLSSYRLAELDIVVSEIASNTFKHATAPGEVLFRRTVVGNNTGVEMISIDNGPGMHNPTHLMEDGVSTTNSMGTGLGAIRRLSDQFDIYSQRGWGTLLLSRVFGKDDRKRSPAEVAYATLLTAYPGEEVCGDGFFLQTAG